MNGIVMCNEEHTDFSATPQAHIFCNEAATAHSTLASQPHHCFHSFAIMSTNWDWANTVQQPTTEQKQVPPPSSYQMNSWNAPQMQSPQEREAPAMMYQTGSPGARV